MSQFQELKNAKGEIGVDGIKKIIPYDTPFLFLDKVMSLSDNRIVATKELTGKEDFFKGHFPGHPIMPAVLTVEATAQVAGVLMLHKAENRGKLARGRI